MRPKLLLAGFAVVYLLFCGLRPDGLPFIPGAAYSDAAVAHFPAAFQLHVMGLGGETAWWELNMAGQPFSANPLNKTAYPPQFLARLLPPTLHLNLMIVSHAILAAFGMWTWTRSLGLTQSAAFVAAVAFACSPRIAAHTGAGHLDLLYALAWFPWLMWAVRRWILDADAGSWRRAAWVTVIAAAILLADLRLSLFAYATAAIYGLALSFGKPRARALVNMPWMLLLWGVLVLPIILPLALWQPYMTRTSLNAAESGAYSLPPVYLVGLLLPPPAIDPETLTYVGLVVLGLAIVAVIRQPRPLRGWLLLCLLAAWYALGSGSLLWQILNSIIPALNWFRVPARAWFVVALIMPLLAGYGVQAILKSVRIRWLSVALAALTFIELTLVGRSWLEWRGEEAWLSPHETLAAVLRADDADRIYSPTYSIEQQVAVTYGLSLFGGVDPFQLIGVTDAIAQGSGVSASGYSVVQPPLNDGEGDDLRNVNLAAIPDTRVLADWQVSHIVAPYAIDHARLELLDRLKDIHIYRNLDYRLTIPRGQIPRWPEQWPNLPYAAQVTQLNQLTAGAQSAGLLAILALVIILLITSRRQQS